MSVNNFENKKLLTEKDVAALLAISVSALQKMRHKNIGLTYLKLGKSVRYDITDVESYIKQHKIEI